jgi:hypothetical protein
MTIPSLPEEQPEPKTVDDGDEIPSAIPQSVMTAVSVILVLALILGSASTILVMTDLGLDIAVLAGLLIALVLVVAWFLLPARSTRR